MIHEELKVGGVEVWEFQDELFTCCGFDRPAEIEAFMLEVGLEDGLHAFGRDAVTNDRQQSTTRFILCPEANLREPFLLSLLTEFRELVGQVFFEVSYGCCVFLGCEGRGLLAFAWRW